MLGGLPQARQATGTAAPRLVFVDLHPLWWSRTCFGQLGAFAHDRQIATLQRRDASAYATENGAASSPSVYHGAVQQARAIRKSCGCLARLRGTRTHFFSFLLYLLKPATMQETTQPCTYHGNGVLPLPQPEPPGRRDPQGGQVIEAMAKEVGAIACVAGLLSAEEVVKKRATKYGICSRCRYAHSPSQYQYSQVQRFILHGVSEDSSAFDMWHGGVVPSSVPPYRLTIELGRHHFTQELNT
ncbi:hypothetical protein HPB50_006682 [Hyalomma asiaticum]|uniref:Uncharacterized protein n=1 Tax=Hyalomma asiaticum TaxID=266040 RepID=A0ACB7S9U0_HYAAI|nr:hypothetical protein HPB50_006682 [Hyalomma asiaticum]